MRATDQGKASDEFALGQRRIEDDPHAPHKPDDDDHHSHDDGSRSYDLRHIGRDRQYVRFHAHYSNKAHRLSPDARESELICQDAAPTAGVIYLTDVTLVTFQLQFDYNQGALKPKHL